MISDAKSAFLRISKSDVVQAAIHAFFIGAFLPIAAAIQTPDFSVATISWQAVLVLALNGGVVGFVGSLAKSLLSDEEGKLGGVIG